MTPLNPTRVSNIAVHHSASPASTRLEDIRTWHVGEREWDDVGYHFVVEATCVRLGRPLWLMGSHVFGHNSTTIGVCIVGDFTQGEPGVRQRRLAVALLADLCGWFSLEPNDIVGHFELADTECPALDMATLRQRVANEIARRVERWREHGKRA